MRFVSVVVSVGLVIGLALSGCGWVCKMCEKRKAKAAVEDRSETSAPGEYQPPEIPAVQWKYTGDPTPAFEGSPDELLTSFTFDRGSATLKQEAIGAIREAVARLRDADPPVRIAIIGFADGISEKSSAEELGRRRAERTQAYLSTLGFPTEQMQIASFGASQSVARDYETDLQASERKVDVWVLR
jgi:outer membrane protein OmpA-like peptidoglycan-associated protein